MSVLLFAFLISGAVAQIEFLSELNARRRDVNPTAINMRKLKWSAELASSASAHAETCKIGYNPPASLRSFVGQTIAFHSNSVSAGEIVDLWNSEKRYYDFDSNTCSSGLCLNYKQINWANTEYVGCATVHCLQFYYYVCYFKEGGNINNARPYMKGASCSHCPAGSFCSNKLCIKQGK